MIESNPRERGAIYRYARLKFKAHFLLATSAIPGSNVLGTIWLSWSLQNQIMGWNLKDLTLAAPGAPQQADLQLDMY
jgi:hypothetical protein